MLTVMPLDAAALGERIKELREATGISIGQAASRAGVTPGYWHALENATPSGSTGKAAIPRVPVLRSIAEAIDADRAEVLELAGYVEAAAWDRARAAKQARAASGVDMSDLSEEDQAQIEALVERLRRRQG